jgi:hypothetical protein
MSTVALNNFGADGQFYTVTRVIIAAMEALKDFEDAVKVLGIKPNAIIRNCQTNGLRLNVSTRFSRQGCWFPANVNQW